MSAAKRNKVYLEIIRIFAIFLVVINHTCAFSFPKVEGVGDVWYWSQLLFDEIVKMAVPLFFMVSGALLLPKDESIAELYKKRVLRFGMVFFFIVTIQYAVYAIQHSGTFVEYLSCLYLGSGVNEFYALWFLKAYLGILIMLPILRIMARGMKSVHFAYMLVVQIVVCCCIPVVLLFAGKYYGCCFINQWLPFRAESQTLPFSYGYCIFYMLLGYFVEQKQDVVAKIRLRWWCAAGVMSLLMGLVCMICAFMVNPDMEVRQSVVFLASFLPVPCIAFYQTVRVLSRHVQVESLYAKVLALLGAASFTVMLFENLFRINLSPMIKDMIEPSDGYWLSGVVLSVVVTMSAMLLGIILKQIPGIRRLI